MYLQDDFEDILVNSFDSYSLQYAPSVSVMHIVGLHTALQ